MLTPREPWPEADMSIHSDSQKTMKIALEDKVTFFYSPSDLVAEPAAPEGAQGGFDQDPNTGKPVAETPSFAPVADTKPTEQTTTNHSYLTNLHRAAGVIDDRRPGDGQALTYPAR